MSDQLLRYYERELAYVRRAMTAYAQRHPEQAAKLHIDQNSIEDPNINRLIDGMALLTAKTEERLDNRFPEIVQGLLSTLYPGYNQILPSYCALQLDAPAEDLSEAVYLPAKSPVTIATPDGKQCRFSTLDELHIQPYSLTDVSAQTAPFVNKPAGVRNAEAVIQLRISCSDPEASFAQLDVGHFDFYVRGFEQNSASLIELLLTQTESIVVSDAFEQQQISVDASRMISRIADPQFNWLPRYGNQFGGFDMLRDYFTYPDKAAYFRITELGDVMTKVDTAELLLSFYVRELPAEFLRLFNTDVFSLNTVPALNLFKQSGEPMTYDFSRLSVPVMADSETDSNLEVIAVDGVREIHSDGEYPLRPLYKSSYRQPVDARQWQTVQRWDKTGKRHMELTINCQQADLQQDRIVLALDLWCCNGRHPCVIKAGALAQSQAAIDLPGELKVLRAPSAPHYPVLDESLNWRFIALLNANFASLLQTDEPAAALQEVLSLCNHRHTCRQADSIKDVSYQQQVAPMTICGQNIFAAGTRVNVVLDAAIMSGQSAVFAAVLNALFLQFCSYDRFIEVDVSHFGDDRFRQTFSRMHGSQLCL
ncbi:type VI secretion system baseplate subunit TssF [Aliamphritea ceti]|uniref:type VI secretion system baseplate subunit TssF n=1 Tax=Aliamphritea ceti TaxID=1524258 RepID=UPI0021C2B6E8|nr:type VI secretion system baseplate subunit TssF [Aliamphritea ceti]